MKVQVNGYGMLPFRATECHKFDGREDLVQFRGEVKLPKGVKTGGGSKWMAHDYWYTTGQITPTYNTAPPEADNFKKANDFVTAEILAYLFGPQCGGESCTNPNCSCKKAETFAKQNDVDNNQSFTADSINHTVCSKGIASGTFIGKYSNTGSVNKAAENLEPTFEELEIERVKQAMKNLDLEDQEDERYYNVLLALYMRLKYGY